MPQIRLEQPADVETIRQIHVAAFGREAEGRLVDRLRASGNLVRALVAEEQGRLLGHVAFSRISIGEKAAAALALAPLAVMPAFQRLGIGSALVSAGLQQLRQGGEQRVIVLGDPGYYSRFGFLPATRFELENPWTTAPESFMAIAMARDAYKDVRGRVNYGHEFDDLE
jgi:putative acetyltransferase